ncbi:hypothetical protein B0H12DRAFT_1287494 [Mycena haematopus]|nr:hypothetical protein B0H12DRAFT_1287494 [Mycena haematopus]
MISTTSVSSSELLAVLALDSSFSTFESSGLLILRPNASLWSGPVIDVRFNHRIGIRARLTLCKGDFTVATSAATSVTPNLQNCVAALSLVGENCSQGGAGQFTDSNGETDTIFWMDPNAGICGHPVLPDPTGVGLSGFEFFRTLGPSSLSTSRWLPVTTVCSSTKFQQPMLNKVQGSRQLLTPCGPQRISKGRSLQAWKKPREVDEGIRLREDAPDFEVSSLQARKRPWQVDVQLQPHPEWLAKLGLKPT